MTDDHSRTNSRDLDGPLDDPDCAARFRALRLTPTLITVLKPAGEAGRRRADRPGAEPRPASAEPGRLPCLSCRRPTDPEPGKNPTCSPSCEAHLGGTIAWLAMLLMRKGPREPRGGP